MYVVPPFLDYQTRRAYADTQAHPGSQASNAGGLHSQQAAGNSEVNTSTSLKGAGTSGAVALDSGEFNLKSVRKQDGPAHSAPGGHIHGGEEVHAAKEQDQ